MNATCRITVKSTRNLSFFGGDPEDMAREFAEALESGDAPFFSQDVPSDRVGDAPFAAPDFSPPEPSVLITDGIFARGKDGTVRISYEDSPITGLAGCLTTFCLTRAGSVVLLRRGDVRTCMIFEPGARHLCDYGAQHAVGAVTLHTHSLHSSIGEGEGELSVEYSVEICGATVERNRLSLSFHRIPVLQGGTP